MNEIFCDDGKIVDKEIDVLRGCCADFNGNAGYMIEHANQYTKEDGHSYQVCSERSCVPMCMRVSKNVENLKTLINEIFAASYEAEKRQQFIDAKKDKWGDKLLWIITIPFSAIIAIYLISRIGS